MKLYITSLLVGLATSTDKASVLASSNYDCNADGEEDCNDFSHRLRTRGCVDSQKCYYKTHVKGARLMRNHCVCRRCFEDDDAAAARVPYDFEDMYQQRFRSWHHAELTCASWVFPSSDEEILELLAYARDNGYKIRPAGSSHSTAGLVIGPGEESSNTIALSLGKYVAPEAGDQNWEFELRNDNGPEDATVVVNAGWTQLMLYEQIRPLDYMLPAATAGPLFQLAGLVANTCHGGWYGKGYIHQYVVRMRVVTHDGTFKIIDDPEELRYWKSSFGLLGIILSLEFKLDHNPKFQQESIDKKFAWNKENFWNFIKQDASADLPDYLGGQGPRQATSGQFFLDAYKAMDGEAEMSAIVFRKNEHAVKNYDKPRGIEGAYERQINKSVLDEDRSDKPWDGNPAVHRYTNYGTLVRENGGPDVLPWDDVSSVNNGLARDHRFMTGLTVSGPGMLLKGNSRTMKDGYFATKVPKVLYSAYIVPAEQTFEALNDIAEIYARREREGAAFKWNSALELRFIELDDGAVMNQKPAGLYATVEVIAFPFPEYGPSDWHTFYEAFKEIQDLMQGPTYQGKAHMGKVFGLAKGDDGIVRPYQVEEACKVYTEEQKSNFLAYKQQMDPDGLFEAGDAMKLLRQCPAPKEVPKEVKKEDDCRDSVKEHWTHCSLNPACPTGYAKDRNEDGPCTWGTKRWVCKWATKGGCTNTSFKARNENKMNTA